MLTHSVPSGTNSEHHSLHVHVVVIDDVLCNFIVH
jgi:hypothetical protein